MQKINHISPVCVFCSLYSVFLVFAAYFRSLYFSVFPVGTFHFSTLIIILHSSQQQISHNITTSISPQIHTAYCCTHCKRPCIHRLVLKNRCDKQHSHSCIYRLDLNNSCTRIPALIDWTCETVACAFLQRQSSPAKWQASRVYV